MSLTVSDKHLQHSLKGTRRRHEQLNEDADIDNGIDWDAFYERAHHRTHNIRKYRQHAVLKSDDGLLNAHCYYRQCMTKIFSTLNVGLVFCELVCRI
jgi:hypothetical protein